MARVKVLYWAQAREVASVAAETVALPAGCSVGAAFRALVESHPGLAAVGGGVQLAVNGELAEEDAVLSDGDELAVLPPVAGG
ncbi:MAG: molybdopterin converting factor subunit 1 [Nitrososphaerota archaeon]|nr:molybdopterin converting factor subunit 1 [Nitrososphaerota archaeon]MDG6939169.1 molybdopterin converting factor subunit 1 [Nitrososphaerota archaeon]